MGKFLVRILASVVAAICTVVAMYCPWGFLCAFEPGQEAWLVRFPVAFAVAILVGGLACRLALRNA